MGIFAAAAVLAVGCKTTEANYKAAYDAAVASRTDNSDGELDENTRRLLALDRKNAHTKAVVNGDTIDVTVLFVTMEEGPTDKVPQYSLTVNAFSQIFNAKALLGRLKEAGFANAYIFKSGTPDYYVAAGGSDDIADIPAMVRQLHGAGNPGSRPGFPAVVRSGGYRPR